MPYTVYTKAWNGKGGAMFKRKTLRKIHIYSGLLSAVLGVYLWLEPKWRKLRKRAVGA